MKLIAGLGNPGPEYADSFHNAGFQVLDHLASQLNLVPWGEKFKGLLAKGQLQGEGFLFLKPQTYMNLSGQSLQACMTFYKLELPDLLVISDDLDLELGQLRFRQKGGHGGHNGLRNIIQLLGSENFARLKVGIGRPTGKKDVTSHVLGRPNQDQLTLIQGAVRQAEGLVKDFILGRPVVVPATMNGAAQPKGDAPAGA